ncbi:MAG: class I SAM-dependent methyltransferase [Geminicoccaceae bacterium]
MDAKEVGRYWNENAEAWVNLSRQGFDVYRDLVNTPAFFQMLPKISNLDGLDIGCGEGANTRLLADRGAKMTALDISDAFIKHARTEEKAKPRDITYFQGNALKLPFDDRKFHFATAFMSLMDIPDNEKAIAEAFRVIKPGGFFQFSITHPSTALSHFKKLRSSDGRAYAFELGGYFQQEDGWIDEWTFKAAPEDMRSRYDKFRIPRFCRTLSAWINALIGAGFIIEEMGEPKAGEEALAIRPKLADTHVFPYFLHIRSRRPRDP